ATNSCLNVRAIYTRMGLACYQPLGTRLRFKRTLQGHVDLIEVLVVWSSYCNGFAVLQSADGKRTNIQAAGQHLKSCSTATANPQSMRIEHTRPELLGFFRSFS